MSFATKTVGSYEAKTHLAALLEQVAKGREIIITKREKPIARLIPASSSPAGEEVFNRIRTLHARLSLGRDETARDLINAGRRI